VRIGSNASWRMKASIFFTSSPVSQLGLATAFATEPATGPGLAVSAAAMYSFWEPYVPVSEMSSRFCPDATAGREWPS
jgi:hypothetical protein